MATVDLIPSLVPPLLLFRRTLINGRSKMLTVMFTGALPLVRTPEGRLLIDRDGDRFGTVLSYLRAGECGLPTSGRELAKLLEEAMFYHVRNSNLRGCRSHLSLLDVRRLQSAREATRLEEPAFFAHVLH